MSGHSVENDALVRVGFRYRDGEILTPEREVKSEDDEIPEAVIDLGDGEWLTLPELRDMHYRRLEEALEWQSDESSVTPPADVLGDAVEAVLIADARLVEPIPMALAEALDQLRRCRYGARPIPPTECNCDGDDGETGHDLLCPRLTRPILPEDMP